MGFIHLGIGVVLPEFDRPHASAGAGIQDTSDFRVLFIGRRSSQGIVKSLKVEIVYKVCRVVSDEPDTLPIKKKTIPSLSSSVSSLGAQYSA